MSEPSSPVATRWTASIVVYQSKQEPLLRTLAGLAQQRLPPSEVHVHFNADPTGELARSTRRTMSMPGQALDVRVSWSADNQGFAGAHNMLLARAFSTGAHAVLVLNPDVWLEAFAVRELDRASAGVALAGPLLLLGDPVTLHSQGVIDSAGIRWTRTGRHHDDQQGKLPLRSIGTDPYAVAGITGACLWVPRDVYNHIVSATGEFFDADFIAYREDAELGLRASRLGIPQLVVPTASAVHGRTLRHGQRGDPGLDRLGVRNRFLIAFKHGRGRPGAWFGAPVRDVLVLLYVVVRERHSIPAIRSAWKLRAAMRAKGKRLRAAERDSGVQYR